ncbi:zinc-binding dehydrogenase [Streptomyces sp. NPDC021020]|uniref:zinc-binding dehydrogenase n=1 Tax=Streptomyces sp. NPDC021020 TaxID=3365109 RepID=UPI0037A5EA10
MGSGLRHPPAPARRPGPADPREVRLRPLPGTLRRGRAPGHPASGATSSAARASYAAGLEELAALVAAGRLAVHVQQAFPLERLSEAHALLAAGGVPGKLAISV